MFLHSILFVQPVLLRFSKAQDPFVSGRQIRRRQASFHSYPTRLGTTPDRQPCIESKSEELNKTQSSAKRTPDELFSSFDAAIDDLERDLEQSIGRNRGEPSGSNRRHQEQQEKSDQARKKHFRRLEILTSLPAELSVEHVPDRCSGCGVVLQSATPSRPGYLPHHVIVKLRPNASTSEKRDKDSTKSDATVCQRCYRLSHYGTIDPQLRVFTKKAIATAARAKNETIPERPNNELSPQNFRRCLEQLQTLNAVVVYLVDIFDFSGSFIPALRDVIGARNPIILAVNKVDLLPPDYKPSRVLSWIQEECRSLRLHHIDSVHLISSVRGTGVADLLADAVSLARKSRANIYIVGAANVGKSSFINQVISRRKSVGNRVQIAQMPVTEPVSTENGSSEVLESNDHDKSRDFVKKSDDLSKADYASSDSNKYVGAQGSFQSSEKIINAEDVDSNKNTENEDGGNRGKNVLNDWDKMNTINARSNQTDELYEIDTASVRRKAANNNARKDRNVLTTSVVPGTTLDVIKISLGKHINLYDTPGLMVSHQLTNLLDEKDLRDVVPSKAVENVSFRLTEGKALYIGGLARIELISGRSFFFTCFFSAKVTVHPGKVDGAESFTKRHIGGMLTPPSSKEGFERLGDWTSKAFTVEGDGWKRSSIDVVLSGLGWVSITGPGSARVRIWAPKDVGVFTREPLMPFEIRDGVSSFTGSRAINRRQVIKRQRRRKANNIDNWSLD